MSNTDFTNFFTNYTQQDLELTKVRYADLPANRYERMCSLTEECILPFRANKLTGEIEIYCYVKNSWELTHQTFDIDTQEVIFHIRAGQKKHNTKIYSITNL